MKHVISILLRAGEAAETNAPIREKDAEAFARDGDHERAENLRAQASLDREVAAECREALPMLQIMATVQDSISGLSEGDLKEVQKAMLAELQNELANDELRELAAANPDNPFLQGHVEALDGAESTTTP